MTENQSINMPTCSKCKQPFEQHKVFSDGIPTPPPQQGDFPGYFVRNYFCPNLLTTTED